MNKKLALIVITIAMLLSACTKSFGGHSVTVNVPTNGCGVTACTTAPANLDIIVVK